jgi:hypothetical protein
MIREGAAPLQHGSHIREHAGIKERGVYYARPRHHAPAAVGLAVCR